MKGHLIGPMQSADRLTLSDGREEREEREKHREIEKKTDGSDRVDEEQDYFEPERPDSRSGRSLVVAGLAAGAGGFVQTRSIGSIAQPVCGIRRAFALAPRSSFPPTPRHRRMPPLGFRLMA